MRTVNDAAMDAELSHLNLSHGRSTTSVDNVVVQTQLDNHPAAPCLPAPNPSDCFWQTDASLKWQPKPCDVLPQDNEIVIIGGGFAGVSTAYHIFEDDNYNGQKVTLIEARDVCSGATGRNGGHLRPDLYGHIPDFMRRTRNPKLAAAVAEFETEQIFAMKKFIEQEKIDCDFSLCRTYDVWCDEEKARDAKDVIDMISSEMPSHMKDVVFHMGPAAEGICGVKGAKACASYTAATLWPYKFVMHVTKMLLKNDKFKLCTQTTVKSVKEQDKGGFILDTTRGSMTCTQVVHASNAYVSHLLPEYKKAVIPCKGICCHITLPDGKVAPLLNDSYINRTEDSVLSYLIPRHDGSIVVGGAQKLFKAHRDQWYNNVDDSVLIESTKDYYEGYMQRTFRGWEDSGAKIDNIWTGVMGYSFDTHPHIGQVPGRYGQFVLAGFNGHGMPVIWLSAKALAGMVTEDSRLRGTSPMSSDTQWAHFLYIRQRIPRLFATTRNRLERAEKSDPENGDILKESKTSTQQ